MPKETSASCDHNDGPSDTKKYQDPAVTVDSDVWPMDPINWPKPKWLDANVKFGRG